MTIVGKTRDSASFRRNRWLLTALLCVYFVYTFIPILYLITAATKTNPDLFTTFGLWFSGDFHLFQNLHDLFTKSDGVFGRWLWNTFYYAAALGTRLRDGRDPRGLRLRQVRLPRQAVRSTRWCSAR